MLKNIIICNNLEIQGLLHYVAYIKYFFIEVCSAHNSLLNQWRYYAEYKKFINHS